MDLKIILFCAAMLALVSCDYREAPINFTGEHIPLCADINKTGSNCVATILHQDDANFIMNTSICKRPIDFATGYDYCFDAVDSIPRACRDLDSLNYITLNISREEFEKFSCSRRLDYLKGWCYPKACKAKNPPVCYMTYMIYCHDEDDPKVQYSKHQWISD